MPVTINIVIAVPILPRFGLRNSVFQASWRFKNALSNRTWHGVVFPYVKAEVTLQA
jgi:hypothetical protein